MFISKCFIYRVFGGRYVSTNYLPGEATSELRLTAFEAFLLERPTPDQLLEFIALRVLASIDSRAALIAMLTTSGHLALVGRFGQVDGHCFSTQALTVWNSDPLSQALKEDFPRVHDLSSHKDSKLEYFATGIDHLLVIPLIAPPQPSAVVAFGSTEAPSLPEDTLLLAQRVGRLASLYLGLSGYLASETTNGQSSSGAQGVERRLLDDLTPRQEAVLQLMAQGMRNKQIAFTIGYSESLVRQETMEIYRKLGVKGRHEAAALARRLGLTKSQFNYLLEA